MSNKLVKKLISNYSYQGKVSVAVYYNEEYEEYKVVPSWNKAATYFCGDIEDAMGTARHMLDNA